MQKDPLTHYRRDIIERVASYQKNTKLQQARNLFHQEIVKVKYAYNFFWFGVPILQLPQDLQAIQEIIWEIKPDLIIETGIAWGGSIIFSASMLWFLESCNKITKGQVIGIDIDIRPHNKRAILAHPLASKIKMYEGSSLDKKIIRQVTEIAKSKRRVMVCLDSNHTHDHVLAELRAYSPLVSIGSYCIVGDTGIEDLPPGSTNDRPWSKNNNPKTAVRQFLKENNFFKRDELFEAKVILTGSPEGYLKRIK